MDNFTLISKYNNSSIFNNDNFYDIYFNDNSYGWLKFKYIDKTLSIYMSIKNIEGYILWTKYIDDFDFMNIELICTDINGTYLKKNINYSKLIINFHLNIKNINDIENYIEQSDFFYKILLTDNNKTNNLINFNKINNINKSLDLDKNDINKLFNINNLLQEFIKLINNKDKNLIESLSSLFTESNTKENIENKLLDLIKVIKEKKIFSFINL